MRRLNFVSWLFIALYPIILTPHAQATDIEDGQVVSLMTSCVEAFEVMKAEIIKQEVTQIERVRLIKALGILELELKVQGNICSADPKSLSVFKEPIENESFVSKLRFMVNSSFSADPWGPITACLTYGRFSTIKLRLAIDDYQSLPGAEFETKLPKFRIPYVDPFGSGKGVYEVELKINEQMQLVAVLTKVPA